MRYQDFYNLISLTNPEFPLATNNRTYGHAPSLTKPYNESCAADRDQSSWKIWSSVERPA